MEKGLKKLGEHHANLYETNDREQFLQTVVSLLEKESCVYEVIEEKVIDIETARKIKDWNVKEYGKTKYMVLSFHTMTIPAQNALLKVLEEPNANTKFIFISSHPRSLLPTVRSRLVIEDAKDNSKNEEDVKIFLKTKPELRMKIPFVSDLLEKTDENDRKDRESVQIFLADLLTISSDKLSKDVFKELADCIFYTSDASSNIKMILEYLSLRLPRLVL